MGRKPYRRIIYLMILLVLSLTGPSQAAEDDYAGKFVFVTGEVTVVDTDGSVRHAEKGALVHEKEKIISSKSGSAQVIMIDGAYISIRPDTIMRIDVYKFSEKGDEPEKSVISLLKGCFRSITGLIGRKNKENYKITTAVANIGIRGTDHEPMYIPEPEPGEEPAGVPGLYDKVNSGSTYIQSPAGEVTIYPGQTGFAPIDGGMPAIQDETPQFYQDFSDYDAEQLLEDDVESGAAGDEYDPEAGSRQDFKAAETSIATEQYAAAVLQPIFVPESRIQAIAEGGYRVDFDEQTITDPDGNVSPISESEFSGESRPANFVGAASWPDFSGALSYRLHSEELQRDEAGNVTGWTFNTPAQPDPNWVHSVEVVNGAMPTYGRADHYSETGVEYGAWRADALRKVDYGGTAVDYPVGSGWVHWINAPATSPDYLSQVVSGTATYLLDGGTSPTNQDGVAGVLNSATLNADFTRQKIDAFIDVTVDSRNWSASASDIPLDRNYFYSSSTNPSFTIHHDDDSDPASAPWGVMSGSLSGAGLNGAILSYAIGDTNIGETINGVAGFYGPAQETDAASRMIGFAAAYPRPGISTAAAEFNANAPTDVLADSSANIIGFNTSVRKSGMESIREPIRLEIGTAGLTDTGSDAATGISWGRWSGGVVDATDRITGLTVTPPFQPTDLHYVAGPEMTAPAVLPIAGSYHYAFAGGTLPTDNLGNTGTLNAASLSADFTSMTVSTGINVSVGSATFDASANAVPIDAATFGATHTDALVVACSGGGAGTVNEGKIAGAFHGQSGEGAGLVYSFRTTNNMTIDTTVSGAAAFRRE